jgi:hypothetical protein
MRVFNLIAAEPQLGSTLFLTLVGGDFGIPGGSLSIQVRL